RGRGPRRSRGPASRPGRALSNLPGNAAAPPIDVIDGAPTTSGRPPGAHTRRSHGMRRPMTRVAALLTVAAMAVGGAGGAQALASGNGAQGRPGPPSAAQEAALAQALGVSVAQLQAAEQAIRPSGAAKGAPGDLAAKIASALGVDTSKVQAILDA